MTLMITLAPEAEARLRERAAQQGQPTETVAASLLNQILGTQSLPLTVPGQEEEQEAEMTDAEFDAYWGPFIGVIHSGGANMSENCGEKFAEGMAEKRRQGHL